MTRKFIPLIFLLILHVNSYARSIDIQCEYDFVRTENFSEFVKRDIAETPLKAGFYKKYEWWEFWNKRIIYFSINLKTNGVTGGIAGDGMYFPNNTIADVFPDQILIRQEFEYADHPNHKHLVRSFIVNRLNGQFFGDYYEADLKTDKDIERYSMYGKCKSIKRLF